LNWNRALDAVRLHSELHRVDCEKKSKKADARYLNGNVSRLEGKFTENCASNSVLALVICVTKWLLGSTQDGDGISATHGIALVIHKDEVIVGVSGCTSFEFVVRQDGVD